mgnify:CR=1 FL=1
MGRKVRKALMYLLSTGLVFGPTLGYAGKALAQKVTDSKLEQKVKQEKVQLPLAKSLLLTQYSNVPADTTLPGTTGVSWVMADYLRLIREIPKDFIVFDFKDSLEFKTLVDSYKDKFDDPDNPEYVASFILSKEQNGYVKWHVNPKYEGKYDLVELFKKDLKLKGCLDYFNTLTQDEKVPFIAFDLPTLPYTDDIFQNKLQEDKK